MRVVLIQEVPKLGKIGEAKVVKNGFAINYLLAKKLAVLPGSAEAKQIAAQRQEKYLNEEKETAQNQAIFHKLNGQKFEFSAKADAKGKLYGSVGPKEIAKKVGVAPELIKEHFKKIGTFPLKIDLGAKQIAQIEIEIKKS